mmetsp:Transcript_62254/g.145991  ORF Transcript_62254/g.145991 Transcript_62254/m.145991 type:complete len:272 (+) Transcript_62254:664-1479(+)
MAQKFMAYIWLWCVERIVVMPDVLSRIENSEGQRIEKVPGGEQAADRTQCEASTLLKEIGNVRQLRDIVGPVAAILFHLLQHVTVVGTSPLRVAILQPLIHSLPRCNFIVGVRDAWNPVAVAICFGQLDDAVPPFAIVGIIEAGVVLVDECCSTIKSFHSQVKLTDVQWKPRHLSGRHCFDTVHAVQSFDLLHQALRLRFLEFPKKIYMKRRTISSERLEARLDVSQVDVTTGEKLHDLPQHSGLVMLGLHHDEGSRIKLSQIFAGAANRP